MREAQLASVKCPLNQQDFAELETDPRACNGFIIVTIIIMLLIIGDISGPLSRMSSRCLQKELSCFLGCGGGGGHAKLSMCAPIQILNQ